LIKNARDMPAAGADVTFGPFRLALRERTLLRDDAPVPLGGRAFDLLAALAATPGELVSKQAILDRVWPEQVVEESNLQVQVAALRKALGHDWITTVAGRGYRLVVPSSAAATPQQTARPTLVVLPFVNLSGDAAQDYLADGLTEEITRSLSRARWYLVVARSSAFAYKGRQGVDIREVGRAARCRLRAGG
jgi:DNA-binding winged helix-turn-helix (wHTH) protein